MNNDMLKKLYRHMLNNGGNCQFTDANLSYIEIHELKNGTKISVSDEGRLILVGNGNTYNDIEKNNYLGCLVLVEEDYNEFIKLIHSKTFEFISNRNVTQLMPISEILRLGFELSNYWAELSFKWLCLCKNIDRSDFISQFIDIVKKKKYSQKLRQALLRELKEH